MHITKYVLSCAVIATTAAADGATGIAVQHSVQDTGVSGIWILANISYAGMRAQNHPSAGWRVLSFIAGFPGTLLTYFVVPEGGGRAYGIDVPKKP